MAIFSEKKIPLSFSCRETQWHSALPLLAAASVDEENSQVILYRKDGKELESLSPIRIPEGITTVKWHLHEPILTLGTNSSLFYTIQLTSSNTLDVIKTNTGLVGAIHLVQWVADRLITVDSNGVALLWAFQNKQGSYQQITQHELRDSPTEIASCQSFRCSYVGCTSGVIYQVKHDQFSCSEAAQLEGRIVKMSCSDTEPKPLLCVLTIGGLLQVFDVERDSGVLAIQNKVKMGSKAYNVTFTWLSGVNISSGVLAVAAGDLSIRLWDCNSNDTFVIVPPDSTAFHHGAEYWTSVAFSSRCSTLCAGSNLGTVGFWQRVSKKTELDEGWQYVGVSSLTGGSVVKLTWHDSLLCAVSGDSLYVIEQREPCTRYKCGVAAVQKAASTVSLRNVQREITTEVKFDFPIIGIDIVNTHIIGWGVSKVAIYQINVDIPGYKPVLLGNFECTVLAAAISKQFCYCAEKDCVQVRTFQGTLITKMNFSETEGPPCLLEHIGNFLCAGSKRGIIKIWDISLREPKLHTNAKSVAQLVPGFAALDSLKLNCDGTCVSFTTKDTHGSSSQLYLWPSNANAPVRHEMKDVSGAGSVRCHYWDEEEPRIVLCQLSESNTIRCLLVSQEFPEIMEQDSMDIDNVFHLIGVALPRYVLVDSSSEVSWGTLQSLASLEQHNDKNTRDALITFGCHLRSGRVEMAYQAVRSINSPSVWKSLATYSVKLLRPDVGLICLGKLGNARAARAVRLAQDEYKQPEAVCAVLAVQLGMIEEAEDLCKRARCYSLLGKIYEASNRWEDALRLSETEDRINLKQTYYKYAKHLESEGNIEKAIEMYEKSKTHHFEVPRMLYDDIGALENYCTSSSDPELLKWWAQYLESTGEMSSAMEFYKKAGDHLSLVRLQCYLGDVNSAAELATQGHSRAACFHMARQYEANGDVQQTLKFFAQAGAFGSAVRLCKEQGLDDQLYTYALQGGPEEQIDAARYFQTADEDREPRFDRAVLLYTRAGLFDTALDLAFKTNQHEAVVELASHMNANASPASLQRCAQYLVAQQHYDTAVELLASAGKYSDAIDLCMKHDVKITEKMAEKLGAAESSSHEVLIQLAEAAQQQGDYQLAAKKFTQAGDRMRAMKALLKSGDTEKIVFFASISRQREIYVLAANYLQTLDWRSQPELLKHIITFYNKARAVELLAGFYESCAQAEIDEYCDYTKALGALKEALQCMNKSPETQNSSKSALLRQKFDVVQECVEIERLIFIDPEAAEGKLVSLMSSEGSELEIFNAGALWSKLVKLYADRGDTAKAVQILDQMKSGKIVQYVEIETVQKICDSANIPSSRYVADEFVQSNLPEEDDIREIIQINRGFK